MRKIFPIITILILFSLLGIIFFQILWIKGALESEEKKFSEHISMATYQASEDLMVHKGNLFPTERFQIDFFKPSVAQRFSVDEIRSIIRKAFDKQNLHKVPFEFAISTNSIIGESIQSENFFLPF